MLPDSKKKLESVVQYDSNAKSYLNVLPNEILIKIFLHLCTKDLISISQTCLRFSEIANDKTLLQRIDLRSCYGFKWSQLTKFLRRNSHKQLIQHVHLDNCYWIDWSHDTRFLRSCPNLKSLTLVGIPVTFTQLLPVFLACKQIKFLAVSYNNAIEEADNYSGLQSLNSVGAFESIHKLHMVFDKSSLLPPQLFWETFDNLEELCFMFATRRREHQAYIEEDTIFCSRPRGMHDNKLPKLRKLITSDLTGKLFLSTYNYLERKSFPDVSVNRNVDKSFLTRLVSLRNGQRGVMQDSNGNTLTFPNTVILYRLPESIQSWPGLNHLGISLKEDCTTTKLVNVLSSCTEIKSLVLLIGPEYQEHTSLCCIVSSNFPRLQQLCVLKTAGATWMPVLEHLELPCLTHLSLPTSAIYYVAPVSISSQQNLMPSSSQLTNEAFSSSRTGFKRSRIGMTDIDTPELLPLSLALSASPNIKNLELGLTEEEQMKLSDKKEEKLPPSMKVAIESLTSIRRLIHLTHLTLHNLPLKNGQFLIQIAQDCTQLKSLRLKDLGPSGLCCYLKHLCQALQYCSALKDLRIEQNNLVPCRDLFHSLTNYCRSLQRVVIISPTPSYTSYNPKDIIDLVTGISSLVFGYFYSSYITQKDEQLISRAVKKLLRGRPELVVRTSLTDLVDTTQTGRSSHMPPQHITEMVEVHSWARQHNIPTSY